MEEIKKEILGANDRTNMISPVRNAMTASQIHKHSSKTPLS
jgi:hypothetical protein